MKIVALGKGGESWKLGKSDVAAYTTPAYKYPDVVYSLFKNNIFFRCKRKMDFIKSIPSHMDFDGQGRAEKYSRFTVTLFGVVGLIWGYIIQQFSQAVYILGAGFVLAALLTIPPWPIYRRKPLQWQKPRPDSDSHHESSGKSKKKK